MLSSNLASSSSKPSLSSEKMPVSKVGAATRALVAALLLLGRSYQLALQVNRDSSPEQLAKAYRKVLLKTHPDKGGRKEDQQKLQAAKDNWESARKGASTEGGRPRASADVGAVATQKQRQGNKRKEYRVCAAVVLLTYHGFTDLEQWHRFVAFVRGSLKRWNAKRWGATLEACETGGLHTHLVLQFTCQVDRTARSFTFEGLTPNVREGDYLGEGLNKKRHQLSVDRGFFYVFVDKVGTQREADARPCFEGNHVPVWVKAQKGVSRYAVQGKWCENLWKERKLEHGAYEKYLYLTRDGVLSRKRNLEEVKRWEEAREEALLREAAAKRVKAKLFKPFEEVPAAKAWLALFSKELDRYPVLVVLAPSRAGKTE